MGMIRFIFSFLNSGLRISDKSLRLHAMKPSIGIEMWR